MVYDENLTSDDNQREHLVAFERALTSQRGDEPTIELRSGITVAAAGDTRDVTLDRQATAIFWVTGGKLSQSQQQVSAELSVLVRESKQLL